jgi:hypothetical protein
MLRSNPRNEAKAGSNKRAGFFLLIFKICFFQKPNKKKFLKNKRNKKRRLRVLNGVTMETQTKHKYNEYKDTKHTKQVEN